MNNRLRKTLGLAALFLASVLIALFFWLPSQYVVPVVMYHSIAQYAASPLNNVRPDSFERQMAFLKNKGYNVISVADYIQGMKAHKNFDHRTVVITFDDGFEDNFLDAYPILKKYGFPATIFMPSDHVGIAERLSWDQLKEMTAHGITIGSHTRFHVYLPGLAKERLLDEIVASKKILEQNIGRPVDFIAYPSGGFTDEAKSIVQQAGYAAAFTTNRGGDRKNQDIFAIKRIRIKDEDSEFVLSVKLSGYYNFIRIPKRPH